MLASRSVAMAALPGMAAIALWGAYRHAVQEISAQGPAPPDLPGEVRTLPTAWGGLSYRLVTGSDAAPPLVLVHGWGRSADSVWWRLIGRTGRTTLLIDLPGHGRSHLDRPFTFDLAAEAITTALADAGVDRPVMVGHSMGGPVILTVLRRFGAGYVSGLVAIATSAYWIRPRLRVMAATAPYLLAPSSPIISGAERAHLRHHPERAAWIDPTCSTRPARRVLEESAIELRRFDARQWRNLTIPPAVWVVTRHDGVIAAADQRSSAHHFGAPVVDIASDHPVVMRNPQAVAEIINRSAVSWE